MAVTGAELFEATLSAMATARLHERAADRRVRALFRTLFADSEASRLFVVLRNSEALPDALAGNDLDVSVLPGVTCEQVLNFIAARARELGWVTLCVSRRAFMCAASLVDVHADSLSCAIHIDIFRGISAFGIPLLSPDLLQRESAVRDGVREPSERMRALATLAHHFACTGALTKDKYVEELTALLAKPLDREWLLRQVSELFGARVRRELATLIDLRELRRPSLRRRLAALVGAMRGGGLKGTITGMAGVAQYVAGQLPSVLHPPGIVGSPGEGVASAPRVILSPELASGLSPLAMVASTVRVRANDVWNVNAAKHRAHVRKIWRESTVVRWVCPALFLWWQAKRGRVVMLDQLPLSIRILRRLGQPGWLTIADRRR